MGIPALIIGSLGLLFLLPLLGIPILDILGGMMSDVVGGGHGGGYSAPSTGYGYVARGDTTYYDQTIADFSSRWPHSRRARQTCAAPSTTTTRSAKVLRPPTMWDTAPRQEDNWLDPEDFCGLRTIFTTSTTHALENRGRGGEYDGTEGVAVIQH